jgi:hypothetical protein
MAYGNVCTALLDNGIRDNFSVLAKSSQFQIYQSALCKEKYDNFQSFSKAVSSQNLNLTTSYGILGLTGDSNSNRSNFKEQYAKFCSATYDSSETRATYDSHSNVINVDLAKAFNQCVSTIATHQAKSGFGLYIDITPQDDYSNFTVRINRPTSATTMISDISPPTTTCKISGADVVVPFAVSKAKFTMDCKKDSKSSVVFQVSTENEGFSNTVRIPNSKDRLYEFEARLRSLEYDLSILAPTTVIIAVASDSCPTGWQDYVEGYGRFIRGIDKSNSKVDLDGRRNHSTHQDDIIKTHTHGYQSAATKDVSGDGSKSRFAWNAANYTTSGNAGGGGETRPKNVALLLCQRK